MFKNLFQQTTKIFFQVFTPTRTLLVCCFLLSLISPDSVFAQASGAIPTPNSIINNLITAFNVVLSLLSALIWPVLIMIGGLLQTDIIFGGRMESVLLNMWTIVRNFVNVFFVGYIIYLSLSNLFSSDDKLKGDLVSMIIAMIAVNFTFIAVKVLIDLGNLGAVAMFSIPQSIDGEMYENQIAQQIKSPKFQEDMCTFLYGTDGADAKYATAQISARALNKAKKAGGILTEQDSRNPQNQFYRLAKDEYDKETLCEGKKFKQGNQLIAGQNINFEQTINNLFGKFDASNAAIAMAVNFQKIHTVKSTPIKSIDDLTKVAISSLLAIVMMVIYMTGYLVLFVVLLIRLVVIWLTLMFAPILIFSGELPFGKIALGPVTELANSLWKRFFQSITQPIALGAVFSLGYVLLREFQFIDGGQSLATSLGEMQTGEMSTVKELVLAVLCAVVVWVGIFQVTNDSLGGSIIGGIRGLVGGVGNLIKDLPQFVPLIPISSKTPGGAPQQQSLASLVRTAKSLTDVESLFNTQKRATDLYSNLLGIAPPKPNLSKAVDDSTRKSLLLEYAPGITTKEQREEFGRAVATNTSPVYQLLTKAQAQGGLGIAPQLADALRKAVQAGNDVKPDQSGKPEQQALYQLGRALQNQNVQPYQTASIPAANQRPSTSSAKAQTVQSIQSNPQAFAPFDSTQLSQQATRTANLLEDNMKKAYEGLRKLSATDRANKEKVEQILKDNGIISDQDLSKFNNIIAVNAKRARDELARLTSQSQETEILTQLQKAKAELANNGIAASKAKIFLEQELMAKNIAQSKAATLVNRAYSSQNNQNSN
jgi:hypothetical protein